MNFEQKPVDPPKDIRRASEEILESRDVMKTPDVLRPAIIRNKKTGELRHVFVGFDTGTGKTSEEFQDWEFVL